MYTIIQYLVFILLTMMSLYYVVNRKIYVLKNPFDKNKRFVVDNLQYLLLFLFATAIISCGGALMAYRLLTAIIAVFSVIFIMLSRNKPIGSSMVVVLYLVYLLWLIFEIIISPVKGWGGRVFLKYLYPLLILIAASQVSTSQLFYFKAIQVIFKVALFGVFSFLLLGQIPIVREIVGPLLFWGTAILDFFPVAITLALLYFSYTKQIKYLVYAVLFILPSIIYVNRTGILCASIAIITYSLIRYKVKSIPYVLIGLVLLVGTILYVPGFKEKMFRKQMTVDEIIQNRESLSMEDIDTNGREAMWAWSLKNYYEGNELTGSGLGVLQEVFQNKKTPFGIPVVHNDYIQILCDTGLIGFSLYILTLLSLIIHSIWIYLNKKKYHLIVRDAAFVSGVSLISMLPALYTDNVVNYSLMTLSFPFALYGMMLGLKKSYPIE